MLVELGGVRDPGVVDQNVEPAPAFGHARKNALDFGLARDVGDKPFLTEFPRGGRQPLGIDIDQQHFGALSHESFGNPPTDPLRRAGHHRALAFEPVSHCGGTSWFAFRPPQSRG